MKLYEHQAKDVFSSYRIPVPEGEVVFEAEEAARVAEELGGSVVVKAQVLVGGRGKAGGIKFASSPEEARSVAEELFSLKIKDLPIERLLVEEKLPIEKELYLGMTIDRGAGKPVLMISSEGGVDIEEVAAESPEKIISAHLEPGGELEPYQARQLVSELGTDSKLLNKLSLFLSTLYRLFRDKDAEIAEINPLVLTEKGVYAADAKLIIDEDALFRQQEFKAEEGEMPYVELDGNVGCIVNGAGLAMSTMDTLMQYGGKPANFLDIGGGASAEVMAEALEKVSSHAGVSVILINILGGITRCDEVARGILKSIEGIEVPIVVRLRGTNEEEGKELLREKGIEVETVMTEATKKAIAAGKE